jgi:putative SOS response-associated peptidase YedK
MCYSLVSATRKKLKYAIASGASPEIITKLEEKLEELLRKIKGHYYTSGYDHPELITYTEENSTAFMARSWGLIPHWVKEKSSALEIRNQTLNARGETIFEKPAFKIPAQEKRCIVLADAFYEYHHRAGKTFPYHISFRNEEVMPLAGLYDDWLDTETGELIRSVTIVTTKANELMREIHNNPKADEARMPVILTNESKKRWLSKDTTEAELRELILPYNANEMKAHTVRRQKVKEAIGNVPEAEKEFLYSELVDLFS